MKVNDIILIGIAANQLADSQEEFDEIMRDVMLGEEESES